VALARPQAGTAETQIHREGVDVVLAVDVSGSMLAEDFKLEDERTSRLDAVKAVVRNSSPHGPRTASASSCSRRAPTRSAR
jgi:Ca-activated chloride channel family protein